MVTVEFPEKGDSSYWVCEPDKNLDNPRDNIGCRSRQESDLQEGTYRPGLHTKASIERCKNGIARMEILLKGDRVEQIGFVCAEAPTAELAPVQTEAPIPTLPVAPAPAAETVAPPAATTPAP
jgi:hypothetical protein